MLHVPDTGPGKRVPGAGARTEGREASRQSSEVGAVCRKAARTVLCGGRPVMGVPTAIATASFVVAPWAPLPAGMEAPGGRAVQSDFFCAASHYIEPGPR
jgi:hypothetical protein